MSWTREISRGYYRALAAPAICRQTRRPTWRCGGTENGECRAGFEKAARFPSVQSGLRADAIFDDFGSDRHAKRCGVGDACIGEQFPKAPRSRVSVASIQSVLGSVYRKRRSATSVYQIDTSIGFDHELAGFLGFYRFLAEEFLLSAGRVAIYFNYSAIFFSALLAAQCFDLFERARRRRWSLSLCYRRNTRCSGKPCVIG